MGTTFSSPHPVYGFDLDGVIIDHTANKLMLAERYGVTLTPNETHAELMGNYFSPQIYAEIRDILYNETPEALSAPLVTGAFHGLELLHDSGVPYVLISLRYDPRAAQHLLELRGLWGTYFTPENVYFVPSVLEKYRTAASLGVTHFTDDEPNVLDEMYTIPNRILFDVRSQFPERDDLVRVMDWKDLPTTLLGLK